MSRIRAAQHVSSSVDRVDDIDRRFADLRAAGVTFEGEPHLIHRDDDGLFGPAGNEEWMAFFRDSEQNLLGLAEGRLPPLNSA